LASQSFGLICRGDLVLGAVAHLDEQLTEQLAVPLVPLFGQGFVNLLGRDDAAGQQQLTELGLVFEQSLGHSSPAVMRSS
jgi:hypothetical protein